MKPRSHRSRKDIEPAPDLGQLLGDFPDLRAGPLRAVGALVFLLGCCVVAVGLLPEQDRFLVLAGGLIVSGVAAYVLGAWRNENRLLVYEGGMVHRDGSRSSCFVWRDLDHFVAEQEEWHGCIGLIPYVRYPRNCQVRKKGGTWVKVHLPPLPKLAFAALEESWNQRPGG